MTYLAASCVPAVDGRPVVDLIIGVATADRGAAIFATAAAPSSSTYQQNIRSTFPETFLLLWCTQE